MYLLFSTVMLLALCRRFTREPEGVGFEPTVGFPTLDFESSALNRTQPPFLQSKKRRTRNVQHTTSNATVSRLGLQRWALDVERLSSGKPPASRAPPALGGILSLERRARPDYPKNVTIFDLPPLIRGLHIV